MNKILKNIFWIFFDKLFLAILQFFVGTKIANHYGSESFGVYNLAITIVSFSTLFFELINERVIKKYFLYHKFNLIVYNVNFFRNTISIILFLLTVVFGKFYVTNKLFYYTLILLCFDNILLTTTSGIEIYFNYKLNSKNIVIMNNIIKLLSYILQYIGILLNYSIIMVPITRCLGSILRIFVLKKMYKINYLKDKKSKLKINMVLLKKMYKESIYLWLGFLGSLVYTQMDKLMLGGMLGNKAVGVYSVAVALSQFLAIIIFPIQVSIYPKMLELYKKNKKEYYNFYQKCNTLITQFYLIASILSVFVVKLLFLKIYSLEYVDAISVYAVLTISIFFKANGALQTGHVTIRNIAKKIVYKTFSGLIINMILNYFFIKKFGIIGAALATTITNFITLFLLDFFIKEYYRQAIIQLKSLNIFNLKNIKNMFKMKLD
jgi:MOP/MATE family multidrug/oligosaccharidyl-lipid/polysaccharide flippase